MHAGVKLMEQRTGQRDRFELLNNGSPSMFKDRSSDCRCSFRAVGYLLRCFESCSDTVSFIMSTPEVESNELHLLALL